VNQDPVVALVLVRAGEAEAVARELRAAAFQVGPHLGIAMAVTAERGTFERFFAIEVEDAPDGGWVIEGGRRELPLGALPPQLAARIQAVTFEEPAEPVP
jgi:hypothetical protein